jgi:hypothetical protein
MVSMVDMVRTVDMVRMVDMVSMVGSKLLIFQSSNLESPPKTLFFLPQISQINADNNFSENLLLSRTIPQETQMKTI